MRRLRSPESNSEWPCGLGGSSRIRSKRSRSTRTPVGPRGRFRAAVTGQPRCGAAAGREAGPLRSPSHPVRFPPCLESGLPLTRRIFQKCRTRSRTHPRKALQRYAGPCRRRSGATVQRSRGLPGGRGPQNLTPFALRRWLRQREPNRGDASLSPPLFLAR